MNIILINWKAGENDVFSAFNACVAQHFQRLGRTVKIIDLDQNFVPNLLDEHSYGIDFAVTWQGLGSSLITEASGKTIWDDLRIPLFCIHGDHPSHMPANHAAQSDYVLHNYFASSFCHYANKYIERKRPAVYYPPVIFHDAAPIRQFEGDFFVLPKNLDDTGLVRANWRRQIGPMTQRFLLDCSHLLEERMRKDCAFDHHALIDEVLDSANFERICAEYRDQKSDFMFHFMHSQLDKHFRNLNTEITMEKLADVPLRVYGRGWESWEAKRNPKHSFFPFGRTKDGDFQFGSQYGILDIAASVDMLHDRSTHAIACESGFLAASGWRYDDFFAGDFDSLFFNPGRDDVRARAEAIMADPLAHRERSRAFGREFKRSLRYHDLLKHFETLRAPYWMTR